MSCLIFFIAKRMPVSGADVGSREERRSCLNINAPSSLSPVRLEYSPGGLCLLKFPHGQLCARRGEVWGSFHKSPQVLWAVLMTPGGGGVALGCGTWTGLAWHLWATCLWEGNPYLLQCRCLGVPPSQVALSPSTTEMY